MHTLLELKNALPAYVHITNANKSDSCLMNHFDVPKKSWLVMDRGYINYPGLNALSEKGVYFVVRSKEKMLFNTITELELDAKHPEVLKDHWWSQLGQLFKMPM